MVPIKIGESAVDPVTGDLSSIIGVRINPETGMVIPVTQSSSAHRKRKPPPGATTVLEDEVVARRSFWRRQQQREGELTLKEYVLMQNILYNMEATTLKQVEESLEYMSEKAQSLEDAAKRETQRRSEAEEEFLRVLPADVTATLIEGDEQERKSEESHHAAHKKLIEVVRKFVQKLQEEEKRYQDRLADLEDAMNPDAVYIVQQRYQQGKSRLQAELKDQILTKMEALDEEHALLQYIRQRNDLLTQEAKQVLIGAGMIAGDYDCILAGVYGDVGMSSSSSSNNELVPLLRQLIAMLESGRPFVLSPEFTNIIQGGDLNVYGGHMGQLNNGASTTSDHNLMKNRGPVLAHTAPTSSTIKPTIVKSQLVQQSANEGAIAASSVLVDPNKLKPGATSPEERKQRMRDLLTKQTYEAAKLENDLKSNDINSFNTTLNEYEKKKANVAEDLAADLRVKLAKGKSDEESEKLMMDYSQNLQKMTDALEKQKQQQLEQIRKQLLDQRRKEKKELHKMHINEAKALGLEADIVPDMTIPSHGELDRDLRQLAQEQEKLAAEMQRKKAEQEAKALEGYNKEMEERIKSLHLDPTKESELLKVWIIPPIWLIKYRMHKINVVHKKRKIRDHI